MDSLVQTVRAFNEDIGTEFRIEKCAMLVMEKGKIVKSLGIELPGCKLSSHYRKVKVKNI